MLFVSRLFGIGDRIINEYEAVDGMRIVRGTRSNKRKPATVPFCSL
jgi:hypothetical protein